MVDEKKNIGKITIDSGAAGNMLPRSYLPEIPLQASPRSQRGACFIAANGTGMKNLANFEATNGVKSNILCKVIVEEATSVCVQDCGQGYQGRVRA